MHEKPKLQVTRDYSLFEMHPMNRDLSEKPLLLASMKEHGFMPSSPIQCIRSKNGRLLVVRGHHRLHYAKRLGIQVWYVVDESCTDIYDLEGDSSSHWDVRDFLSSRAKAGDKDCRAALEFIAKHDVNVTVALSLLVGYTAGSGNAAKAVRAGTFKVVKDLSHASAVMDLVHYFRGRGVRVRSGMIAALSLILRVPEFSADVLKRRYEVNPEALVERTTSEGWLQSLDALYNHGAKARRAPLAFEAKRLARERQLKGNPR